MPRKLTHIAEKMSKLPQLRGSLEIQVQPKIFDIAGNNLDAWKSA